MTKQTNESESLGVMIARMKQKQTARDWNKKSQAEKVADLKKKREELKKRMEEGKNHSWKSEGHYTKDGKEWSGPQHAHDGQVMTGEKHTADSQNLYHFKELSPEVKKKVLEKMKMDEGIVNTIMKSKTLNKKNYAIAAKELDKKMKKDPSKTKSAHAHDVARYVKGVDARKLAAEGVRKADDKAQIRKDLEKHTAEFLKRDGKIQQVASQRRKRYSFDSKHIGSQAEIDRKGTARKGAIGGGRNISLAGSRPDTAASGANKSKYRKESVDMTGCPLLEKLSPSDGIGTYIKDFKKSDAPQFKGASASKRRKMAVAAYLGAKRKKMEESMQYDSTMGVMDWGTPKGTQYMKDNTPGESQEACHSCEGAGCSHCNYRGTHDRKINVEAKEMSKKNPVAKNLNKFNKPATHRDRKNDYSRKDKHKGKIYEETEAGETKAEYRADNEINAPEAGIVPLSKDDIAHLYAEIDNMTDEQMDEYGFWDDCDCEDDCDCNDYESDVEWEDGPGDVEITEVLSVQGRLKRKFAARKNRQKLKVARNIALRRGSSPDRLKKRATRGARAMVYKRLLKGRNKATMPPAEKARFERLIGMYQPLISRFAQRMLPRMRKMEISRMKNRTGKKPQKSKKYRVAKPVASSQKAKKFKVKKR